MSGVIYEIHSKRLSLTLCGIEIQSVFPVTLVSRIINKKTYAKAPLKWERKGNVLTPQFRQRWLFEYQVLMQKMFENCVLMNFSNFYAKKLIKKKKINSENWVEITFKLWFFNGIDHLPIVHQAPLPHGLEGQETKVELQALQFRQCLNLFETEPFVNFSQTFEWLSSRVVGRSLLWAQAHTLTDPDPQLMNHFLIASLELSLECRILSFLFNYYQSITFNIFTLTSLFYMSWALYAFYKQERGERECKVGWKREGRNDL